MTFTTTDGNKTLCKTGRAIHLIAALALAFSQSGTAFAAPMTAIEDDPGDGNGARPNCNYTVNVNESFNIPTEDIAACQISGAEPPQGWIKQEGVSFDVGGHEYGGSTYVPAGRKPSNSAVPYYESAGCGYIQHNTRPGGQSDGGTRVGACGPSEMAARAIPCRMRRRWFWGTLRSICLLASAGLPPVF